MTAFQSKDLHPNPMVQFAIWFDQAQRTLGIRYPNACCLSTVDDAGFPEGRMVLLKGLEDESFSFYTNSLSQKGKALRTHPFAALTFYWDSLQRQVRVQGNVELVQTSEADEYFASRPRESQIGAWASKQSAELQSREELENRFRDFEKQFEQGPVPRPEYWNGYRLSPNKIEFWQERPSRLHDRLLYIRTQGSTWTRQGLYP